MGKKSERHNSRKADNCINSAIMKSCKASKAIKLIKPSQLKFQGLKVEILPLTVSNLPPVALRQYCSLTKKSPQATPNEVGKQSDISDNQVKMTLSKSSLKTTKSEVSLSMNLDKAPPTFENILVSCDDYFCSKLYPSPVTPEKIPHVSSAPESPISLEDTCSLQDGCISSDQCSPLTGKVQSILTTLTFAKEDPIPSDEELNLCKPKCGKEQLLKNVIVPLLPVDHSVKTVFLKTIPEDDKTESVDSSTSKECCKKEQGCVTEDNITDSSIPSDQDSSIVKPSFEEEQLQEKVIVPLLPVGHSVKIVFPKAIPESIDSYTSKECRNKEQGCITEDSRADSSIPSDHDPGFVKPSIEEEELQEKVIVPLLPVDHSVKTVFLKDTHEDDKIDSIASTTNVEYCHSEQDCVDEDIIADGSNSQIKNSESQIPKEVPSPEQTSDTTLAILNKFNGTNSMHTKWLKSVDLQKSPLIKKQPQLFSKQAVKVTVDECNPEATESTYFAWKDTAFLSNKLSTHCKVMEVLPQNDGSANETLSSCKNGNLIGTNKEVQLVGESEPISEVKTPVEKWLSAVEIEKWPIQQSLDKAVEKMGIEKQVSISGIDKYNTEIQSQNSEGEDKQLCAPCEKETQYVSDGTCPEKENENHGAPILIESKCISDGTTVSPKADKRKLRRHSLSEDEDILQSSLKKKQKLSSTLKANTYDQEAPQLSPDSTVKRKVASPLKEMANNSILQQEKCKSLMQLTVMCEALPCIKNDHETSADQSCSDKEGRSLEDVDAMLNPAPKQGRKSEKEGGALCAPNVRETQCIISNGKELHDHCAASVSESICIPDVTSFSPKARKRKLSRNSLCQDEDRLQTPLQKKRKLSSTSEGNNSDQVKSSLESTMKRNVSSPFKETANNSILQTQPKQCKLLKQLTVVCELLPCIMHDHETSSDHSCPEKTNTDLIDGVHLEGVDAKLDPALSVGDGEIDQGYVYEDETIIKPSSAHPDISGGNVVIQCNQDIVEENDEVTPLPSNEDLDWLICDRSMDSVPDEDELEAELNNIKEKRTAAKLNTTKEKHTSVCASYALQDHSYSCNHKNIQYSNISGEDNHIIDGLNGKVNCSPKTSTRVQKKLSTYKTKKAKKKASNEMLTRAYNLPVPLKELVVKCERLIPDNMNILRLSDDTLLKPIKQTGKQKKKVKKISNKKGITHTKKQKAKKDLGKSRKRTRRIPVHYRTYKPNQIRTIKHMKMRYRVAFSLWPDKYKGALDKINQRLLNQNAFWNAL